LSFVTRPWVTYGLLLSLTMSGLLTTPVQAEWYFGGYGGIANPGAFSNVTVSDPTLGGGVTNARINDLELKSTFVGGVQRRAISLSSVPGLEKKQEQTIVGRHDIRESADNLGPVPLRLHQSRI
jgi:hypothetical protein